MAFYRRIEVFPQSLPFFTRRNLPLKGCEFQFLNFGYQCLQEMGYSRATVTVHLLKFVLNQLEESVNDPDIAFGKGKMKKTTNWLNTVNDVVGRNSSLNRTTHPSSAREGISR